MQDGERGASASVDDKLEEVAQLVRHKVDREQVEALEAFVRRYYAGVPPADLARRSVADLYGGALAHWNFGYQRDPGKALVRVYTPELEQYGWQSTHSVAEMVNDDMPFLVDSVTMALTQRRFGIHLVVHPVVAVRRDEDGMFTGLDDPDHERTRRESFIRVEFDRQTDPDRLTQLRHDLEEALGDVRVAVEDWQPMRAELERILETLEDASHIPCEQDEVAEIRAFLRWLHDDHFTFLGYRAYDLVEDEETTLRSVPETGLGILRQDGNEPTSKSFAKLPPEVRQRAREPNLLMLTKANSRATVHRPAYLDYVGVKRFDDAGEVAGEWRFLGLYTSAAYHASPTRIPLLRRKVDQVLERSGARPTSHDYKDLLAILERYPRDELIQTPVDDLYPIACGIHYLQERRRVRLFLRRDVYGRFYSCLVFLPRDRYNTTTRLAIQDILMEVLEGSDLDYTTRVSESVLARLHFVVHTEKPAPVDIDHADLERRLADATRDWTDDLENALVDLRGEERGVERFRRFGQAFPAGYRTDTPPRMAVRDIDRLDALRDEHPLELTLYHPVEAPPHVLRFKLYHVGRPIPLSQVLPILENLGVEVRDQRPYAVDPAGARPAWIYDFGLVSHVLGGHDTDRATRLFTDAFAAVWDDQAEDDAFNQLVLAAAVGWREVAILRAYGRYLRQVGSQFSQAYMAETLGANGEITRLLVDLFRHRFDPARKDGSDDRGAAITDEVRHRLDTLPSLDEDRILRAFLRLTLATMRTNYFAHEPDGSPRPHLAFKLDPAQVPDLPRPRPSSEIWVYSPTTEGVHLRAGRVARGGIRWSDRREDFRTEILGLMKAQRVKNAVIVPTGAKGGFVVKRPLEDDRERRQEQVVASYRTLIEGMLDVTDNLVDGEVDPPRDVVRHDGDDPYLVVAADKGTATFSDTANAIADEYDYWLGDAFASGGSVGFDHKAMGITARGAWVSVKHHFAERGVDVQNSPIAVVGIGDMSGDVFGNGMLQSRHIRLVAAFNHRHIFVDPDPDPRASFEERQRLFAQERSSWDDYDRDVLSTGGTVFERTARSVRLSEEIAARLGLETRELSPNELIRAILRADVDLLFNGGIGTYVKATAETHTDVGDKANDAVRVDAGDLRCTVVGEGGNLGVTQRGRIEFALGGGAINTDAIDNSAGVDTSDHEVNIKILLNRAVDDGELTERQRNELIDAVTDEVTRSVLEDTIDQNQALSCSLANATSMVRVHRRYLRLLEQDGMLDRRIEALPDDETLAERTSEGRGLTRPEFAVLLPYTKNWLQDQVLDADLPDDPDLEPVLVDYFPAALRERFRPFMGNLRLRRELVATQLTNDLVNRSGTTFVFRLMDETGAEPAEIVRAHTVAASLFGLADTWQDVLDLGHDVPAEAKTAMLLEARRLVERATRWLLRHRVRPLPIDETVANFNDAVEDVADVLPDALAGSDRDDVEERRERYLEADVPAGMARRIASYRPLYSSLDIATSASLTDDGATTAAAIYFRLADRLELAWVRDRTVELPRDSRWETLARDALRDDLYSQHATLTTRVLTSTDGSEDPAVRIDAWVEQHPQAVERCRRVIGDIRASGRDSFTTLTVALRELRNLVEASA